jgi:hypothetical protein
MHLQCCCKISQPFRWYQDCFSWNWLRSIRKHFLKCYCLNRFQQSSWRKFNGPSLRSSWWINQWSSQSWWKKQNQPSRLRRIIIRIQKINCWLNLHHLLFRQSYLRKYWNCRSSQNRFRISQQGLWWNHWCHRSWNQIKRRRTHQMDRIWLLNLHSNCHFRRRCQINSTHDSWCFIRLN